MDKKTIVLTLYGTGNAINDFTVTLFDGNSYGYDRNAAVEFCSMINELEIKDDKWIHASVINENRKIKFEKPNYIVFDMLGTLDDLSIQKVHREVNSQELAKALKTAKKETLKAVLRNMSKRAAKMLLEDMEYMGPVRITDVKEAQSHIVEIIRHLEDTGEIVVAN